MKQRAQLDASTTSKSDSKEGRDQSKQSKINVSENQTKSKRSKQSSAKPAAISSNNISNPKKTIFSEIPSVPLFEETASYVENIVEVSKEIQEQMNSTAVQNIPSAICAESEEMGEVPEVIDNEEENFQDLDTVDEHLGETSFQDVENLFGSFL